MENSNNNKPEAFKIMGNWANQTKELKNKYSLLTDEDLKFENGKENELLNRVGSRLKKGREEVINIIKKGQPKTA